MVGVSPVVEAPVPLKTMACVSVKRLPLAIDYQLTPILKEFRLKFFSGEDPFGDDRIHPGHELRNAASLR